MRYYRPEGEHRTSGQSIRGLDSTLRSWEKEGKIQPERRPHGHRRYDLAQLSGLKLYEGHPANPVSSRMLATTQRVAAREVYFQKVKKCGLRAPLSGKMRF